MQLELLKDYPRVVCRKMRDAGEDFKKRFDKTPATAVCALKDWDGSNGVQSVYYDCERYTANLFHAGKRIFIRCWYLFAESVYEEYYDRPCETWDAAYENLPVVDTLLWEDKEGLVLEEEAEPFSAQKEENGVLTVSWGEKSVTFRESGISLRNMGAFLKIGGNRAGIRLEDGRLKYSYKGTEYALEAEGGRILQETDRILFVPEGEGMTLRAVWLTFPCSTLHSM